MARTAVLGFPRIGPDRELKHALEAYWRGGIEQSELAATGARIRAGNLGAAAAVGIDLLPVGDFAYYDHVLDAAEAVGIVAERHGGAAAVGDLDAHFLACRGAEGVRPLEMTKWFDTNYHYLVPELDPAAALRSEPAKWIDQMREAAAVGHSVRPALLGPVSLLLLSKGVDEPLRLLPELTAAYVDLLAAFAAAGAAEVQLDEPALVLDRTPDEVAAFAAAYAGLIDAAPPICLATYFAGLDEQILAAIGGLDLGELHIDLVRAPEQLDAVVAALGAGTRLSAGVIDGRNVWATDLDQALGRLDRITAAIGSERLTIAPSCSLMHVPYTVVREERIDPEIRPWLAFGTEKLAELALLGRAVDADADARDSLLADSRQRAAARRASERRNRDDVRARVAALEPEDFDRSAPIAERRRLQAERLRLPPLPTTTIGSYPQTDEIRTARRRHAAGELDDASYREFLEGEIGRVIASQQEIGLDVLVHGEPERNDMVEYFGEQLDGFTFSQAGWVQSYGSRCVKPPILYGDVSRPAAMTVDWWRYAQSLSEKPLKGMLTGPVTILQWSFVRDDQPIRDTCLQIALAIQDEVADLEAAGAAIIQVDEAALREGLPLKRSEQDDYVRWAVDCFRLTAARARPVTQIHTHMCYSEFGEMIEHIGRLDADVISIEASRSGMELLESFRAYDYPGQIGPGVYDIHSPRVPSTGEIETLLELAAEWIPAERLWVNPDCGLKTRAWPEALAALTNLVEAAARARSVLAPAASR